MLLIVLFLILTTERKALRVWQYIVAQACTALARHSQEPKLNKVQRTDVPAAQIEKGMLLIGMLKHKLFLLWHRGDHPEGTKACNTLATH
jgi:hypothetical protein